MQHEITEKGKLLNSKGSLSVAGYSKKMLLEYDRKYIKASGGSIKEWDYYLITCDKYALALTIADNSYMGLSSISFIDYRAPWQITKTRMAWFTNGKTGLPSTSATGSVAVTGKDYQISFENTDGARKLTCKMSDFKDGKDISAEIVLSDVPEESMVIATPFPDSRTEFYYNQKINCMTAEGTVHIGDSEYVFDRGSSFGTLDWGRGVWPYKNTWYWGSASGLLNGHKFGFNIGMGFGDTSAATENMLFYDGKAHKLSKVDFLIPISNGSENYIGSWNFTGDDGRFVMNFKPIIDRYSDTNALIISSCQHQVFGLYSGRVKLDDGTVLEVKNFLGFAEKVKNKW